MAAAVGAYHLLKGEHKEFGRRSVSSGLAVAAIFSVLILVTGHFQAVEVVQQQPVKMAAMEGHWDTGPMPLGAIGFEGRRRRTCRRSKRHIRPTI